MLLAVRFYATDLLDKARERALDVILVNSKGKDRPDKAQAKARPTSMAAAIPGRTARPRRRCRRRQRRRGRRPGREHSAASVELEAQQQQQ